MAARSEARVIAIDADPVVVGKVWRQARGHGLDVLSLVVDLARPSPALGWGTEQPPAKAGGLV